MGCCEGGDGKGGGGGACNAVWQKRKNYRLKSAMEEQDKISNGHFCIPIFRLAYANTHGICIPTVFEFKSQHGVKLFIGHKPVFFWDARRWIKTLSLFFVKLMRTTYIQEHYQTFFLSFFCICLHFKLKWCCVTMTWHTNQSTDFNNQSNSCY